MPARLTASVCLALTRAVRAVDFTGRGENQERATIKVYVWIFFELLLGFDNRSLPSARVRNFIERLLDDLLHPVLVYVHLRLLLFCDVQLMNQIIL